MPSFQKLYDKYKNDVAFYFVSNEQPQPILNFIERKGYTFPIYIATSMPPKEFDAAKLPTTYVLNKQGKIVMEEVGAHDWFSSSFQEKLEVMLGE